MEETGETGSRETWKKQMGQSRSAFFTARRTEAQTPRGELQEERCAAEPRAVPQQDAGNQKLAEQQNRFSPSPLPPHSCWEA